MTGAVHVRGMVLAVGVPDVCNPVGASGRTEAVVAEADIDVLLPAEFDVMTWKM